MKTTCKSILEIAKGEILKKSDYELSKIIANINDPNTSDKKKRKLTITLTFEPVNDRKEIILQSDVKAVLAPLNPTQVILANTCRTTEDGEIINVLQEVSTVAPGQLNIDGDVFEPEMVLIGHDAHKTIPKNNIIKN